MARESDVDNIWTRVAAARTDEEMAEAEALVSDFRATFSGEERGWAAICMATACFGAQQFRRAEVWALRALQGTIRRDALCLLGEIAWLSDDAEGAVDYYRAALQVRGRPGNPELDLAVTARQRCEELTKMIVPFVPLLSSSLQRHEVVIMTVPGRETFERTMASLQAANSPEPTVVRDDRREGQAKTFFRALEVAARAATHTVTIVEDDIALVQNAFNYISRIRVSVPLLLISWYSSSQPPLRTYRGTSHLVGYEARVWSGAPAITLTPQIAREILDSPIRKEWTAQHQADTIFGLFSPGAFCAVHYPNLVDHIGGVSLTGNSGLRSSVTFPGEDFDACSLLS